MRVLHWYRLGLRLHDNPSLLKAIELAGRNGKVFPVFILEPQRFRLPSAAAADDDDENLNLPPSGPRMHRLRHIFLQECLADLDTQLQEKGSRLLIVQETAGSAVQRLEKLIHDWKIDAITFENDIGPYARKRDAQLMKVAESHNIQVFRFNSQTLYDLEDLVDRRNQGQAPKTMTSLRKLLGQVGPVPEPVDAPEDTMPGIDPAVINPSELVDLSEYYGTLLAQSSAGRGIVKGGETLALKRLEEITTRPSWVAAFEKPKTSPTAIEPSTTVLSPYLASGCLSARHTWYALEKCRKKHSGKKSQGPVSLHGQLLWREFYYMNGYVYNEAFGRMEENPICRSIPWVKNETYLQAWEFGRTGYPFIDASMNQLRTQGWIHHLSRHAVACFLTRGDLWQNWEDGAAVFERYLLDGDWSLNIGNWLWVSASAFFHQYFRVYSPIAFGKKTDPEGQYVRKWVPVLRDMPSKYIYEPWKAPAQVQAQAHCIIGRDYPKPIVNHGTVSKENQSKMASVYSSSSAQPPQPQSKKRARRSPK